MSNLPAHLVDAIGAMEKAAVSIDTAVGDFSYLKLTKAGEWVHGADEDEINPKSLFAVSTESFCAGFQAWDDGVLAGEEIALLTSPPVTKADLENVGADWKPLIGFHLLCISGPDKGLVLSYKTTSKGGIKEVNTLMKSIVAHVKSGKHDGNLVPVVALTTDSYRHKKYGKIYTPVIEIADWLDEVPNFDQPAAKAAAEPEPEIVEEEELDDYLETPVRRRRQRA